MATKPLDHLKLEALNREVTPWLPILNHTEVKSQLEPIENVPLKIEDLSKRLLSNEDRSYMDIYLTQEEGEPKVSLDPPYRIRSIQKIGPKLWTLVLGMITIPTLTKVMGTMILMALIIPLANGDEHEGPYRTVLPDEDPMFIMTDHSEIHEIENNHENFTLSIQTSRSGPFVMVATDHKIQGYHKITNIVDLAPFALEAHNAYKFLEEHNSKEDYSSKLGWKVPFQENIKTKYEYLLYPFKIDYDECKVTCPILNSSILHEIEQVREGMETFQDQLESPDLSYVWINTQQKEHIIAGWTWKQIYAYQLEIDGIKIYPENKDTMTNIANCTAFKDGNPIDETDIGHVYRYYERGTYNWHRAYQLEAAMNANYKCKVMVPQEENSVKKSHNDQNCMCVRYKQTHKYNENKIESRALTDSFKDFITDIEIEDWRMVSNPNQTITLLTENFGDSGMMSPTFPKIDKVMLKAKRTQFLTEKDVTRLEMSTENAGELKASTVMKGLTKLMVSHPRMITGTHEQIQEMLKGKPGDIKLMKSATDYAHTALPVEVLNMKSLEIRASKQNKLHSEAQNPDAVFALNNIHSPMIVRRNNGIITVEPKDHKPINWQEVSQSGKASDAEIGIREARHHILEYKEFQKEVLPKIMDTIVIPPDLFNHMNVNTEAETIIIPQHRGTYVEIDIFVPIFMQQSTRKYQIGALPYHYSHKTNEFTRKELPEQLNFNPTKGPSKQTGEPETPCEMAMVQGTDHLETCPNEATKLEEINELFSFSNYRIFLIGKIGTASISCPSARLRWIPFNHQVQLVLLHKSCFLETRMGRFNLHILPEHNMVTNGISSTLLLAYDITDPWIPTKNTRWVLLIIILAIIGTIGLTMITGIAMIIKSNPWFMIMKGEVPDTKKVRILKYVKTKLSERKEKGKDKSKDRDMNQPQENSYENLSDIDQDLDHNDPGYQSFFYRNYGDELEGYQTVIRNKKAHPEANLKPSDIHPQYLANALAKTKEAIRRHEETDPTGELELPMIEVHAFQPKSRPQLPEPPCEIQHGIPARH